MAERSRAQATATADAGEYHYQTANNERTISGHISTIGSGVPIGGLVVEAINLSGNTCLGSSQSDSNGLFDFSFWVAATGGWWYRRRPCPIDLRLEVLTPERPNLSRSERLLFCTEARRRTTNSQSFLIELDEETVKAVDLTPPDSPISVEARVNAIETQRADAKILANAKNVFLAEDIAAKDEQDTLFRDELRPAMEAELSNVTDREKQFKEFVPGGGDIAAIQLNSAVEDIANLVVDDAGNPVNGVEEERPSSLLLTEDEKDALVGDNTDVVEKSEEEIESALGTSLDKPALIERRDLAFDTCLPPMDIDECLEELLDVETDDDEPIEEDEENGDGTSPIEVRVNGENRDGDGNFGGNGISFSKESAVATLTDRMTAPEDPVEFGLEQESLEPRLTIDQVSANIANVTFAPGPADVPAFHNFSDLQVAFAPVWQEVIDDRFVDDAEVLYEKFVEKGGNATFDKYKSLVLSGASIKTFTFLTDTLGKSLEKRYGNVAGVVIITEAEWDALPEEAQDYLDTIVIKIKEARDLLLEAIATPEEPPDGSSIFEKMAWRIQSSKLSTVAIQNREKIRLLENDADQILAMARRLVLENEANQAFAPTHQIIERLKSRHRQSYPFRPFAASKTHKSINFGILVTYQQIWTPKSYQVGELVKTIPMAPSEERSYSRKVVSKTRKSVKTAESIYERTTGETSEKGRIESEILRRATAKTNFDYQTEGTVNYGTGETAGFNVKGSQKTGFSRNVEKHSKAVKKEFNEQVRKATQEVKSENKTEIDTQESFEEELTETGKLVNPNDEIPCTFMFYELQRRYQVEEKLHQLQSVILVAQEVPKPTEIDKAWLISHDWILSRVLLDPSFVPALGYLSTSIIAEEVSLKEMRKALFDQKKLVEELKEDLADRRSSSGLRYAALQKQIEKSAKKAEGGGGFFGKLGDIVGSLPGGGLIEGGLDLISGDGDAVDQASELRESAARDAFDRERREEQSLEGRVSGALSTLSRMQDAYTEKLSDYLTQLAQCHRLIDHVVDNILYYMQAIWAHEHRDQQELRLRHVQVPIFEKQKAFKKYAISSKAVAKINKLASTKYFPLDMTVSPGIKRPPPNASDIKTQDLFEVADLGKPLGVWANYLIFPMLESNVITEYMMEPYVTLAEKEYGVSDPDILGNMTLSDFTEFVCCLKKESEKQREEALEAGADDVGLPNLFEELKSELRETLKKLLERAGPAGRDIVVPMDGLYIEALPGTHSVLERFKHMHRQIDVKQAQAEVRDIELENVRKAERVLQDELNDPDIDGKYVFEGTDTAIISPLATERDGAVVETEEEEI